MRIMRSASRLMSAAPTFLGMTVVALAATTAPVYFDVTLTVTDECTTTTPGNLSFGTHGVIQGTETGQTSISVHCTTDTAYDIGLDAGLGPSASTTTRKMRGPQPATTSTVSYKLYQDAGYATNWGEDVGTDTKGGTGTGQAESISVYGKLTVQNTPVAGDYLDTITVVITY